MSTRDLVLIALFTAIIAALGILPPIELGFIPVPITAQSFGVMLAGAVLGARRGALSVALLLVLVAIGLPLLAGGRGGFSVFTGPTAGFLIGWIAGAFVTGLAAERLVRASQGGFGQLLGFFAASVIGGVATTGGIGSPIGAIFGAGIIAIIENIIVLFGVSPYWQGIVSGAIVVLAISFDAISRRYLRRDA